MRLSELLAALPKVSVQAGGADPDISLVTADSRRVVPGALFVAVRGDHFDGHDFIPQAIEKGAAAIVAEGPITPAPSTPSTTGETIAPDAKRSGGGERGRGVIVPDSRAALDRKSGG